jgi:peptidyl-prolyl cis-trans isomerase SurA
MPGACAACRSRFIPVAVLAPLLTLLASSPPAHAEPVLLEGIAAQVGDEIILESEVYEQLAMVRMQFDIPDSNLAAAREEIMTRLIDEKIIVQEARAQGITVSSGEVEQAVEQYIGRIRENIGGDEALQRELASQDMTYDDLLNRYREGARQEMLYARLVQREIYANIEVTDEEVEAYYKEHRDELPKKNEQIRLAHIFFGIRPSDDEISAAQDRLNEVRRRLNEGESFADIAKQLSDDPGSREFGGDLGWFERGQLDASFEQVAFDLEVGEVSEPFQTANGVELVTVTDKDTERDRVRAAHILIVLRATEADAVRAQERADRVLKLARSGIDFASLAREYSEDEQSAAQGGDLGEFTVPDLMPFVAEAVNGLDVGEFSDVVKTEQGLHIFKVTERQASGEFALAEVHENLRNAIMEERAVSLTEEWLADIRSNYFVKRTDQTLPWHQTEGQEIRTPRETGSGAETTIDR